jgi:hypothetical protein
LLSPYFTPMAFTATHKPNKKYAHTTNVSV